MSDEKAKAYAMSGEELSSQMRRVQPLMNAYRRASIAAMAAMSDEFHAAVMLATHGAAKFGVSEEDFILYARQQFILARGAINGTLAEDIKRVDAMTREGVR